MEAAEPKTTERPPTFPPRDGVYTLDEALRYCRQDRWEVGIEHLYELARQEKHRGRDLPSLYYSYLGYGVAFRGRRIKEGIRLCRHAVKAEWFQPENYWNLARTYLLADNRRGAFRALAKGLKIDPNHPDLVALHQTMGHRRLPIVPFLSRRNLVNRFLGYIRHSLRRKPPGGEGSEGSVAGKGSGARAGGARSAARRP